MAGPTFENVTIPWDQNQVDGDQMIIKKGGLHSTHQGSLAVRLPTGDRRSRTNPKW